MEISRRDFLRYVGASALAMGLSQLHLDALGQALASSSAPPVVWLSGSSCTGCSISLLNAVNPTIDQVLTQTISLRYHPNVMAAAGDLAVSAARSLSPAAQSAQAPAPAHAQAGNYQVYIPMVGGGPPTTQASDYILVVEGAIPTANGGKYCYVWDEGGRSVTMAEAVTSLAARAKHIIAVGTCAAFGGIPAVYQPAGAKGLGSFLNKPVINLPGCPAHPDWIIGSLALLIGGTVPALDSYRRPTAYYTSQVIHQRCPRREREEAGRFGLDGLCLKELGCRGPQTHADCDRRLWNNGQNWCIGVNSPCIACTEPSFPSFPLQQQED